MAGLLRAVPVGTLNGGLAVLSISGKNVKPLDRVRSLPGLATLWINPRAFQAELEEKKEQVRSKR